MSLVKKFILLPIYFISFIAFSQDSDRFESEIQKFEAEDSVSGYQEDFILFTGSSSIRLWNSLESDMQGLDVLNRGFGGATLKELNQYWNRITSQHKPNLIVLYCGENDIAEGVEVGQTVDRFKEFLVLFRQTYPTLPLIYIAMKPSLARWNLWGKYQEADRQISEIIAQTENVTFIDLSSTMIGKDGALKRDIFIEDGLHMNRKGYAGWKKELRPLIDDKILIN